ncbi:1411_t:CDS:2 [Funneliformis geosporum]|nr:1411_t:CDS:2 [Funneliformis geosporum]
MTQRKHQVCLGCGDHFITFKNYDYCVGCAVNGNRYSTKSPCSECDAQEKIYQLLTKNIPLQNLKLITEPYHYEEQQEKLTGLFLHKDADYRTLLSEQEDQSSIATSDQEYLAEEIAL